MAQERFLPVERLIREALDIYTKQGNEIGMAERITHTGTSTRTTCTTRNS
jgi:hypothetical protein